jgi:hypothetical protein
LSAKLMANRSDRHLSNLSNCQGAKPVRLIRGRCADFPHGPECNTALDQEAGYMTATGYKPSEQRPCARGWVHTWQFAFTPLRQAVSGLRRSPGMMAKSARVGAMRTSLRHRREPKCRVVPRHFDFLSVG